MDAHFINHSTVASGLDPPFRDPLVVVLRLPKRMFQAELDPIVVPAGTCTQIRMHQVYFWALVEVLIILIFMFKSLREVILACPLGRMNYIGACGGSPRATTEVDGNNAFLQGTQASNTLQGTCSSAGVLGSLYPGMNPRGDGDSDDEDAHNPGNGVALSEHQKGAKAPGPKRVYCPWYLRDPQKHRSCSDYKFKDWKDLREHFLTRKHRRLVYCENCGIVFKGELKLAHAAWEKHMQELVCPPGLFLADQFPGLHITREQDMGIRKLTQRGKRANDLLENWRNIWKILFSNHPCPASPYVSNKGPTVVLDFGKNTTRTLSILTDENFQQEVCNLPVMDRANVHPQERVNVATAVIQSYLARLEQKRQGEQPQTVAGPSTDKMHSVNNPATDNVPLRQPDSYGEPPSTTQEPYSVGTASNQTRPTDLAAASAPMSQDIPVPMGFRSPLGMLAPQWPQFDPDFDPDFDPQPAFGFDDFDWGNEFASYQYAPEEENRNESGPAA